jgi:phosphate acetyltransferase
VVHSVYIASTSGDSHKAQVALGIVEALARRSVRVGVFSPVVHQAGQPDPAFEKLRAAATVPLTWHDTLGVTYSEVHANPVAARRRIIERYSAVAAQCEAVVVLGTDYTTVGAPAELPLNAQVAADLSAATVLVVDGRQPGSVRTQAEIESAAFRLSPVLAVVAEQCLPGEVASVIEALAGLPAPAYAMTDSSPSFPADDVANLVMDHTSRVVTPLRFEYSMLARAQAEIRHIVLPEGSDRRIIQAAAQIDQLKAARITVLGDPTEVRKLASELDVDLGSVNIVDPSDGWTIELYAAELAELRKAKGMTLEMAREALRAPTVFGTMMVRLGEADGMVSGASHTTADTIRPAFQIIKMAPDVDVVSSVFLMALEDRVLVFGDCAVNPNPTPEQLAGIAVSSAATAAAFGVEPRVAMLSYSTGTSGAGPSVDAVRRATKLVKQRPGKLLVEGPIQYDAAVEPSVAASKMPGSEVAGRATVLIFPDLNAGNIAYKAVQRSSGALAIGPVLQGLRKPVNDLSRGATVADIVNTVLITAIQAQN